MIEKENRESRNLPPSTMTWLGWLLIVVGLVAMFVDHRAWPVLCLGVVAAAWDVTRYVRSLSGQRKSTSTVRKRS